MSVVQRISYEIKEKNILLKDPFYFYSQEEISIFTFAHKVFNFSISFLKIAQFFWTFDLRHSISVDTELLITYVLFI